eukprot:SAG31_NODE_3046_length_4750_cov_4.985594_1_plen_76_part_00
MRLRHVLRPPRPKYADTVDLQLYVDHPGTGTALQYIDCRRRRQPAIRILYRTSSIQQWARVLLLIKPKLWSVQLT